MYRKLFSLLVGLIFLGVLAYSLPFAKAQPILCQDVTAIFAPGSGSTIGEDKEWERFKTQIEARLGESKIQHQLYELGSESQNGHKYPAVSIDELTTKLGAWISGGTSNEYGQSVQEGEYELAAYITKIVSACPESKIVLAGYSQGAHVMGNATRAMPDSVRNNVTFTALFGDPKLYLPEGEGWDPPACHNQNFSPWRRTVEDCHTDNGVLGARKPYVPNVMEERVGLWCLDDDFICGSSKNIWVSDGHQEYNRPGGPIDQAAQEIAEKLKTAFTYQSHLGEINTAPDIGKLASVDADVVFVVDHTIDMQEDYPNYFLPKMRQLAKTLGPRATFGFDTYIGCWTNDWSDPKWPTGEMIANPVFWPYLAWQDGWATDNVVADHVGLPYYSPEPECDLSWELGTHVQRAAHDFVQYPNFAEYAYTYWPPDSNPLRIIIPVTNKPYDPSNSMPLGTKGLFTQATTSDSTTLIYPLVPDEIRSSFASLEDLGNTQVRLLDEDQIGTAILEEFGTNPQVDARLTNTDYQVPPGTTLTFNASPILVHDDTIAKYEWDFDGDGAFDTTTTQPTASHTYTVNPLENTISVKVTTASGLTDTASASVKIIDPASLPPIPKAPLHLQANQTDESTVYLTWEAGDNLADKWMIYINDFPLGYTEKDQRFITITDVQTNETNTFSVQAISADYQTSERSTVTLTPKQASLFQQHSASPSPSQESEQFSSATNLAGAFAKVFGLDSTLFSPANTQIDGSQPPRKPSPILIYYMIGGILAAGSLFIVIRWLYRHRHPTHIE